MSKYQVYSSQGPLKTNAFPKKKKHHQIWDAWSSTSWSKCPLGPHLPATQHLFVSRWKTLCQTQCSHEQDESCDDRQRRLSILPLRLVIDPKKKLGWFVGWFEGTVAGHLYVWCGQIEIFPTKPIQWLVVFNRSRQRNPPGLPLVGDGTTRYHLGAHTF